MDVAPQIGWGITISAPHMHAQALEQLKDHLRPGCKALDVGSGSGYLTVAMAQMVGDAGQPRWRCESPQAIGIDHVPELVEWSRENVRRDGKEEMLASGQLQLFTADGFGGAPHAAPFDCIHVGAAPLEVPPALKQQLKPGDALPPKSFPLIFTLTRTLSQKPRWIELALILASGPRACITSHCVRLSCASSTVSSTFELLRIFAGGVLLLPVGPAHDQ
eukprot:6194357-Pleurochrysis_carterae.AAC.1